MHFPILSSCAGNGAEERMGEGEGEDDTVPLMVATVATEENVTLPAHGRRNGR